MLSILKKILGDESRALVRRYRKIAEKINAREEHISSLSQDKLRELVQIYRDELKGLDDTKKIIAKLDEILVDVFAIVREAAKRTLKERHHDVQLIGGQVLFNKGIAEMRTGEGKTLVATLPTFLLALAGKGVHVVTVNDYLARRDAVWMGQVYEYLGLSVGIINRDISYKYNSDIKAEKKAEDEKLQDEVGSFHVVYDFLEKVNRRDAYACDITYGTNSEFGFDYLRDNMALTLAVPLKEDWIP
jgi:preprotein translocase subunit SecA